MPEDKDYYSFEEVLKDLSMEEDELKRLVSAGEIRAFRDKDTMRFKAEDVERLRTDEGGLDELEELDADLDLDLDEESGLELTEADEEEGELVIEDLDLDDTDEIALADDDTGVEEIDLAPEPPARRGRAAAAGTAAAARGAAAPRATRKVGAGARADEAEQTEGALTLALLSIGALLLLLANFVVFSAVAGRSNLTNSWLVNMFGN